MKGTVFILASALVLAASAAAQAPQQEIPVIALCQDGKLVAIQILVPAPDVYTIRIGENPCHAAEPPRGPASSPPPAAPATPERPATRA